MVIHLPRVGFALILHHNGRGATPLLHLPPLQTELSSPAMLHPCSVSDGLVPAIACDALFLRDCAATLRFCAMILRNLPSQKIDLMVINLLY